MKRRRHHRALIETFESRLLYSADPGPAGIVTAVLAAPVQLSDDAIGLQGQRTEIVFVDARTPDVQQIIDDLAAQQQAGRSVEVIVVGADEDGIGLIGSALSGRDEVSAIHVVGHGASGTAQLGASTLDAESIFQRAGEIAAWGDALTDEADLLLYGCDVGDGASGRSLVASLAQLTGADVAASDDPTGSAQYGGDWMLEVRSGAVEALPFASSELQLEWNGVLALTAQGSETLVNTTTSGSQTENWSSKTVAMDANGNYVIIWMDGSGASDTGIGIYGQRYNASGVAQGAQFHVNTFTSDNQRSPQVAMDASGNFVVVWESNGQDGSSYGIYAQRYNSSGVAQGSEFRVHSTTTYDQMEAAVAMDASGNFVVAWQSWSQDLANSNGIYAQRYNSSGVAQGGEFLVNTYITDSQTEPSVAMDGSGNFVIAWQSFGQDGNNEGIYAKRYNSSGVVQGSEFHVSTYTTSNQDLPVVAMDTSGNFVIVWESAQDGSGNGIYGQRYTSSGVAQGGEFQINTTTSNQQQNPVVTMLAGGGFVVTWQSMSQDGSFDGVYMRQYNSSGTALTGEVRVNTTTTDYQDVPSLASDEKGHLVVVWHGNGPGDTDGVFMQRYLYAAAPVVTLTSNSGTYVENATAIYDAGATVTDSDTSVFTGGQLIYQITANGTATDELGIQNQGTGAGQIGLSGTNVTYGGTTIGTYSGSFGNGSTPLTVTLNGNASVAATQALVRAVTYRDTSDAPSALTRTLSLTLSDGTGMTSTPATISLAVVAQNDAPVNAVPGAQSTPVSTPLTFSSANGNPIVLSDADVAASNLQVSLTITNGNLSLSRTTGLSFTSGDGSSDTAMTFTGSLANINAALEGLVYTPTGGYNGSASLGITTSDLGNTGSGGALGDSDSISIQVGAVRFQQDVAGYTGTVDTYISDGATGTSFGNATTVIVDDGSPVDQGLLRFDSMFGSGAGQIPFGATINSASLSFYVTNRDAADTVSLYTMLGSWSEASTWNSLGSGVQMNGSEAGSAPLTTFDAGVSGWNTINGLASSVQVWADNGSNQGWLLASASPGADNWTFASSEYATVSLRPYLTVSYTAPIAPTITSDGGGTTASINTAENATAVTTVTATDADSTAAELSYSIVGGADAGKFSINATTGALSFITAPNYELATDTGSNNVYDVTVQVSDGFLSDTQAIAVTVTAVNDNIPVITSGATASVAENTTAVMTVTATDADQPAQTLTYSIVGGADAAKFAINSSTGALSFATAPDYEAPTDAGGNNVYDVTVQASDGALSSTKAIAVTVTSVNDNTPVITSSATASVAENTTAVMTVTATDADLPAQTLTYSIVGGADAAKFTINSSTGALSFATAPDYEAPTDSGANNVYDVTVQATDGTLSSTKAIAVTVTAVNDSTPVITSGATASVAENTTAVMTVTATDADLPAQTLTYSIVGGADAAKFAINASTGALSFATAPDYEAPTDAGGNNVYDVTVQATDGALSSTKAIAVTVTAVNDNTPVITSGATANVAENTTAVMTVTATDADQPAQTLTYSIVGGADAAKFTINSSTGALSFATAPDYEAPTDSGANNVYDVTVQASDGTLSSTKAITVTVTAVNDNTPVITSGATANVAEN
uniref:cadherin domain-containing protein n=1 Tax=Zoogloea sp. TaxID=49181 RepID=UPI0035B2446B